MEEVILSICYNGVWKKMHDGRIVFDGGITSVISVKKNSTLKELEDEVYEAIDVNKQQFKLSMKWSFPNIQSQHLGCHQPTPLRRDKDVTMFMKTIHSIHAGKGLPPIFVEMLPICEDNNGVKPYSTPFGSNSGSNRVSCPSPNPPNQWESHAPDEDCGGNCWPPWTSHNIFKSGIDVNRDLQVLPDQEEYARLYEGPQCEERGHGDHYDDYIDMNDMEAKLNHEHHHQTPNAEQAASPIRIVRPAKSRSEPTPSNATVAGTVNVVSTPSSTAKSNTSLSVGASGKEGTSNDIKVGQLYISKKELKLKLSVYAMRNNFEYKVKKSTTDRYEVGCVDDK